MSCVDPMELNGLQGRSYNKEGNVNSEFRKVVTAIDMLLSRDKAHPLSNNRISTLATRYEQLCPDFFIQSVAFCRMAETSLMSFVWTSSVSQDLCRIMKVDEEAQDPYSYLHYATHFGLVNQCAYSAAKNPQFTILCHVIGALRGDYHSQNVFLDRE